MPLADSPRSSRSLGRKGWLAVAKRVRHELSDGQITLSAAGVAFFAFLSVFPATATLASVYGLVFQPTDVPSQLEHLVSFLPEDVIELLTAQFERLTRTASFRLSLSAAVAVVATLWSANRGARGIMLATNRAFEQDERRSLFKLTLVSLGLTGAGIAAIVLLLGLGAGVPIWIARMGIDADVTWAIEVARWPIVAVVLMLALQTVYHVAPHRQGKRWQWISAGSAVATVLLIIASTLFSMFLAQFGGLGKTYGPLGAVVMFLMWLYMAGLVTLLGAEVNAAVERETRA